MWAWLPGATEPAVAGRVVAVDGDRYVFAYGQSYLARPEAVPLYAPELPLREGPIEPRRDCRWRAASATPAPMRGVGASYWPAGSATLTATQTPQPWTS